MFKNNGLSKALNVTRFAFISIVMNTAIAARTLAAILLMCMLMNLFVTDLTKTTYGYVDVYINGVP